MTAADSLLYLATGCKLHLCIVCKTFSKPSQLYHSKSPSHLTNGSLGHAVVDIRTGREISLIWWWLHGQNQGWDLGLLIRRQGSTLVPPSCQCSLSLSELILGVFCCFQTGSHYVDQATLKCRNEIQLELLGHGLGLNDYICVYGAYVCVGVNMYMWVCLYVWDVRALGFLVHITRSYKHCSVCLLRQLWLCKPGYWETPHITKASVKSPTSPPKSQDYKAA